MKGIKVKAWAIYYWGCPECQEINSCNEDKDECKSCGTKVEIILPDGVITKANIKNYIT